jgi:hypothetical protein
MVMRRHAPGLVQLLVLTGLVCASPFTILSVKWSPPNRMETAYESASALRDTFPFPPKERVRFRTFCVATVWKAFSSQDLPAPRSGEGDIRPPVVCSGLSGFEVPVSERPPPVRV